MQEQVEEECRSARFPPLRCLCTISPSCREESESLRLTLTITPLFSSTSSFLSLHGHYTTSIFWRRYVSPMRNNDDRISFQKAAASGGIRSDQYNHRIRTTNLKVDLISLSNFPQVLYPNSYFPLYSDTHFSHFQCMKVCQLTLDTQSAESTTLAGIFTNDNTSSRYALPSHVVTSADVSENVDVDSLIKNIQRILEVRYHTVTLASPVQE